MNYAYFAYDLQPCLQSEAGQLLEVSVSATICNNRTWAVELACDSGIHFRATFHPGAEKSSLYASSSEKIQVMFSKPGTYQCVLRASDNYRTIHLDKTTCKAIPKLEYVVVETEKNVASHTATLMIAHVFPNYAKKDAKFLWNIVKNDDIVIHDVTIHQEFSHIFKIPGWYRVKVVAFNEISNVTHETCLSVLEPVKDLFIVSPKPLTYLKTNSKLHLLATFTAGTNIQCAWSLSCQYLSPKRRLRYASTVKSCDAYHRFTSPSVCSVSVNVFNEVSQIKLKNKFRVFVEKPVSGVEVFVPDKLLVGIPEKVLVFVPSSLQDVFVDTSIGSTAIKATFHPSMLAHSATLVPEYPGTFRVRVRAYNNVSSVVVRKTIKALPDVGTVRVLSVGCNSVGFTLRFIVQLNGKWYFIFVPFFLRFCGF